MTETIHLRWQKQGRGAGFLIKQTQAYLMEFQGRKRGPGFTRDWNLELDVQLAKIRTTVLSICYSATETVSYLSSLCFFPLFSSCCIFPLFHFPLEPTLLPQPFNYITYSFRLPVEDFKSEILNCPINKILVRVNLIGLVSVRCPPLVYKQL